MSAERIERRAVLGLAAASIGAWVAGCRGCGAGEKSVAKRDEPPGDERIVSVSPSMTETVFAVGAGDLMVGRTSFCDYPPEATKLPSVGGFLDVSVEAVLALAPTLVVGERRPGGRDLDEHLRAQGVRTFFPAMYKVKEIVDMIRALGEMLGHVDDATTVARSVEETLDRVAQRVRALPRPTTLLLFDFRPLVAAGPDAFPNELLTLAGARNVVTTGGEYPRLSAEGVIALDPDVVIDGSAGAYSETSEELVRSVPGLSTLRALRTGSVRRLVTKTALRPGPRIAEGVEEIADLVHPRAAAP